MSNPYSFAFFSIFLIPFLSTFSCSSAPKTFEQNVRNAEKFTVAFYNVENLFDIYDDPKTNDEQFLPSSEKLWTSERYSEKLENLGRVLSALNMDAGDDADLIGLVEIENEAVIKDLSQQGDLLNTSYGIVHEDSPDNRGIDVGLMYNKDVFDYISHESLRVDFPSNPDIKTRDILYVLGQVNGEDLHVFVNHWSSRRDGANETEYKRLACAEVTKKKIREVQLKDKEALILLMGDFNDYPDNKSILEVIQADGAKGEGHFFNTASSAHANKEGSYNYRGDWVMLDQIMISNALKNSNSFQLNDQNIRILKEEWMMYTHPKYGDSRPNRSYGGKKYFGGYSDHLPVYVQFNLN